MVCDHSSDFVSEMKGVFLISVLGPDFLIIRRNPLGKPMLDTALGRTLGTEIRDPGVLGDYL